MSEEKTEQEKNTKETSTPKKKKTGFIVLISFCCVLGVLLLLCLGWILYASFNKATPVSLLPHNFSLYVHTEDAWHSLEPLLDLQATDIFLSQESYISFRETIMQFRQSPLRTNAFISDLLSRPVHIGFYNSEQESQDFIAVLEMGIYSSLTRLASLWLPLIKLDNAQDLSIDKIKNTNGTYFEIRTGTESYYLKPYKNTVVVSSNLQLFTLACAGNQDILYPKEVLDLVNQKIQDPIKILVDAQQFARMAATDNDILKPLPEFINAEAKSLISLGISDSEVHITATIPLNLNDSVPYGLQPIADILKINSTLPALLSKLGETTQYYTLINTDSISLLKNAGFSFLPEEMGAENLWANGNTLSQAFLGLSLDELIFSWSAGEVAAIGMEGFNTPAFAIKIEDENKRQQVFDRALSSFIVKDDTSLILNGVRLPRIYFPSFVEGILSMMNISLPHPYYFVHDGFIYFSESPETLAAIFNASQGGKTISSNQNWETVSQNHGLNSTVSLFYDLERSRPFFLRSNSVFSDILELYSIGRLDMQLEDSNLKMNLTVMTRKAGQLRNIPGFPKELKGKNGQLVAQKGNNPQYIFWVEDEKIIKSMNVSSMEITEKKMNSKVSLCPAVQGTGEGTLWAVTEEGAVYLLKNPLKEVSHFPILLKSHPATAPVAYGEGIAVITVDDTMHIISQTGDTTPISLSIQGSVQAAPEVFQDILAIYDKGFSGNILLLKGTEQMQQVPVLGLAYGSPSIMNKGENYMAFLTQAGILKIWKLTETSVEEIVTTKLNGVFFTNVVNNGNYFFALSEQGMLYRIALDGSVLTVQLPDMTAKEGVITVASPATMYSTAKTTVQSSNIYVGVDGNVIYGFNEHLELLPGFPVTGKGKPIFIDANGDNAADCFTITMDNKLTAYNLR